MKILIFNWRDIKHSWAGGGEIYIFEQAKRWIKKGNEVTLFCGEDIEKKLPSHEIIDGMTIYRKGGRYTVYLWAFWYYLTRFRGKFDILIDVVNGIPFFSPLYTRTPKLAFVYHVHDKQFFYEIPFPLSHIGYWIEKYVFPIIYRNIRIVAISKTTKYLLMKNRFKRTNISIVYCGINGGSDTNRKKRFSHPTILYLGRIKKYKRVEMLVEVLPNIIKEVPRTKLIIAGWGTEASKLTDIVMKSPLRRRISLMGPVTNAEKKLLLSKSWLFVNPSIGEGWSIAVIEANLYGTPAVAFHVPGLKESIQPEKTGLLVNDKDTLVRSIIRILKNHKLRNRLSTNALDWAKHFDWDKTANESLQLVRNIKKKQ